jgi:hypothetical protein
MVGRFVTAAAAAAKGPPEARMEPAKTMEPVWKNLRRDHCDFSMDDIAFTPKTPDA